MSFAIQPSNMALYSFLSVVLLHNHTSCYKTQTFNSIGMKLGTNEEGVRVHPDTKFGLNTNRNAV